MVLEIRALGILYLRFADLAYLKSVFFGGFANGCGRSLSIRFACIFGPVPYGDPRVCLGVGSSVLWLTPPEPSMVDILNCVCDMDAH